MFNYKVNDKLKSSPEGQFAYKGCLEKKWQNVIYERMTSSTAQNIIFKEAEDAFFTRVDDDDAPAGKWQGEFWGKLMLSACAGYRYTKDEKLKQFIRESTYRVISSADKDGYIGSYASKTMVFRADWHKTIDTYGWRCDFVWNIWCRKYTLWGLIDAYSVVGDKAILDAAAKSCDQLIDMLEEMDARICETGVLLGTPSGSILKPVLELYKLTKNKRYLNFALNIAEQWQDNDTFCAKIITKSLQGIPPHLWFDDVIEITPKSKGNPYAWSENGNFGTEDIEYEVQGKVYEIQSCFEGILELYRITGNEMYFEASKKFFDLLIKYEYNTLFSVGFNDRFVGASNYINCITELCDVIHFIRFAGELYKLTGEIKYIDYIEMAFYNPFLAGINRDGKWGARGIRANESHMYAKQCDFEYNHCCVNNMARTFEDVAKVFAVCDSENVFINLYSASDITLTPTEKESVKIKIGYGYLNNSTVQIYIDAQLDCSKKLHLRIPEWSKETKIVVDGNSFNPPCGEYFSVDINNGETAIICDFDKTPNIREKKQNWRFYPNTPYLASRYYDWSKEFEHKDTMVSENKAILTVGPILLALSQDLGSRKEEIFDRESVFGKRFKASLQSIDTDGICAYNVTFNNGMEEFTLPMCDFASVADTMEFRDYRFTVFI